MADISEGLRERYAEAATRWALVYPSANWGILGYASGDDREHLAAIVDKLAAEWGADLAERMLAVRDEQLSEALKRKTWAIDQADKQFRARRTAEAERDALARRLVEFGDEAWLERRENDEATADETGHDDFAEGLREQFERALNERFTAKNGALDEVIRQSHHDTAQLAHQMYGPALGSDHRFEIERLEASLDAADEARRQDLDALRTDHEAETKALEEENRKLNDQLDQARTQLSELRDLQVGLKRLTTDSGGIDVSLHMAHDMLRALVAAFVKILDQPRAPNYVEMRFTLRDDPNVYAVTIQRPGGKTPGEVADEAKQRARQAETRAELAEQAANRWHAACQHAETELAALRNHKTKDGDR